MYYATLARVTYVLPPGRSKTYRGNIRTPPQAQSATREGVAPKFHWSDQKTLRARFFAPMSSFIFIYFQLILDTKKPRIIARLCQVISSSGLSLAENLPPRSPSKSHYHIRGKCNRTPKIILRYHYRHRRPNKALLLLAICH